MAPCDAKQRIRELEAKCERLQEMSNTWHVRAEAHRQAKDLSERRIEQLEGGLWNIRDFLAPHIPAIVDECDRALAPADAQKPETLRESVDRMRAELPALSTLTCPCKRSSDVCQYPKCEAGQDSKQQHVCGLQGYNGMIDPPCPGCHGQNSGEADQS